MLAELCHIFSQQTHRLVIVGKACVYVIKDFLKNCIIFMVANSMVVWMQAHQDT